MISASPRVLTCADNRRRPLILTHDNNYNTEAAKDILQLKATPCPTTTGLPGLENTSSATITLDVPSEGAVVLSVVSESDSETPNPIFRRRLDLDIDTDSSDDEEDEEEEEDMFLLKRANPVYDSEDENDDEYEHFRPPQKRRRTSCDGVSPQVLLSWCDRIDEDEVNGFARFFQPS